MGPQQGGQRPPGVREGAFFNQQRSRWELPGGSVAGLKAYQNTAGVRPGAFFNNDRARWELPGGSVASMQKLQAAGQWPQTGQQQGPMGGQQQPQAQGGFLGQAGQAFGNHLAAGQFGQYPGGYPGGNTSVNPQSGGGFQMPGPGGPNMQQQASGMGGQLNPQQFQQIQQWLQSPQGQQLRQALMGGGMGGGGY